MVVGIVVLGSQDAHLPPCQVSPHIRKPVSFLPARWPTRLRASAIIEIEGRENRLFKYGVDIARS